MITSKIAQIASLMSNPELLQAQKQSQQADIAFGAFLSQTAGGGDREFFSGGHAQKTVKSVGAEQNFYEKESVKSGYRENNISRSESNDMQNKLPNDATEKLEAYESEVKEVIAEKLGISQEELTQQMEALGLSVLDLMDPSKMAGLVMELTGSDDIAGLLLNEDFQQLIGEISELSQELAGNLDLTPEEMSQWKEQLESLISKETPESTNQELDEEMLAQHPVADTEEKAVNITKEAGTLQGALHTAVSEEEVQREAISQTTDVDSKQQDAQMQVQNPEGQQQAEESDAESSQGEKSYTELTQDAKGNEKAENRQTHITYQTTTQTINQGQTVEVTQTVVQTRVNVEDILRQVSQMTRVIVGQAESSIEMQLNPANLGKVYLQVVSREGVITAQLAAQNEAVKEALESQLVVLKENMNQQGMKVEAIEVTIASHEFERNLEQNQNNAAREQQEEQAQRTGRRNINLNNLDELEGLMSEEETLVAKMMAEQGNSMNVAI